ncbi:urate oxidase [Cryptococcus wingfieldii CBS 7118]|uniref:Uricase n=1 Tax=Cryptococcus wingfieldii CBS 7118 TaxID=1295528 RepID=A0A1E3J1H2_9TREE|nr:urate oxidase [Cryptococcus wingfieldii CBS 7118]ODN94699.1 urate oxidase [Cryptococcus wingfieldii CBS 7118]
MSQPGFLSAARYGKDLVKVARVVRDGEQHHVVEYVIRVLLEGEIETSYTEADNKCVVATDTMKNTCHIFAKTSPYVLDAPIFALHLALHFVTKYAHIHKAFIDIIDLKWSRIAVDGKPHKWSFVRDGDEKAIVECAVDASKGVESATADLKVGVKDLLVLKTSGSAFEDFYRDENTTLPEVADRLFSTSVALQSLITLPPNIPLTIDNLAEIQKELNFKDLKAKVTTDVLETFATDESASVQATLYTTLQRILTSCPAIKEVSMQLPNKHYIPINLSPFGLENGLTKEGGADVFYPAPDPSGLITATVTRS